MPITITVEDAKCVLKALSCYQQQHLAATDLMLQEAAKGKENFTLEELKTYGEGIMQICGAGHLGDRLQEMINDAEKSND